jgi:hypothetical protein
MAVKQFLLNIDGTAYFELDNDTVNSIDLSKATQVNDSGDIVLPNGSVYALTEAQSVIPHTNTVTGVCEFRGIVVRAAVGFPQTLSVFDSPTATGTPIAVFTINALGTFFWDGNWTTPGNGAGYRRLNTSGLSASITGGTSRTIDMMV